MIRCMKLQPFFASRQSKNIENWAKLNYYTRELTRASIVGEACPVLCTRRTPLFHPRHSQVPSRHGRLRLVPF